MNSDWLPLVPNHNRYTDWTLVGHDYYVTNTCLTEWQAIKVKPTRGRLLVVLIIFFACVRPSVSLSVTLNMNSYWDPNLPSKIDTLIGLCLIMFTILLLIFDQRKGEQI